MHIQHPAGEISFPSGLGSVQRRWRAVVALLLAVGVMTAVAGMEVAIAQEGAPPAYDGLTCGHFETQADAQAALNSGEVEHPEYLDADGDGIACEHRWPVDPDSPPAVYEPTSCGHFETQADAQAAFDDGSVPDPENLDHDGDGIACEHAFDAGGSGDESNAVAVLPATGAGSTVVTGTAPALMLAVIAATLLTAGLIARLGARQR